LLTCHGIIFSYILELQKEPGEAQKELDIEKEAKMSFRDIGAVLNKADEVKEPQQRK
jgi:hypothetical protein